MSDLTQLSTQVQAPPDDDDVASLSSLSSTEVNEALTQPGASDLGQGRDDAPLENKAAPGVGVQQDELSDDEEEEYSEYTDDDEDDIKPAGAANMAAVPQGTSQAGGEEPLPTQLAPSDVKQQKAQQPVTGECNRRC